MHHQKQKILIMARNEEKHYGRLNRLILQKEKEEYEKLYPQRPKLDSLLTVEEIQQWLPSIKRDLDFYLKKSMVTCYSEKHIEECHSKVNNLEKEYKAFVRKITQLSSGTLDAIPWTNRAYKRKNEDSIESKVKKDFMPIASPILEQEKITPSTPLPVENMPLMNMPLSFNLNKNETRDFELSDFKDNRITYSDSTKSEINTTALPISNPVLESSKSRCAPVANMPVEDRSLSFNLNKEQNFNLKSSDKLSQDDRDIIICSSDSQSLNTGLHRFKVYKPNTSCVAYETNLVNYDDSSDSDCS